MRKEIILAVLITFFLVPTAHSKKPAKSTDCYKVTVVFVLDAFTFVSEDYEMEASTTGRARAGAIKVARQDHPEYRGYEVNVYDVSACED